MMYLYQALAVLDEHLLICSLLFVFFRQSFCQMNEADKVRSISKYLEQLVDEVSHLTIQVG